MSGGDDNKQVESTVTTEAPRIMPEESLKAASAGAAAGLDTPESADSRTDASAGAAEELATSEPAASRTDVSVGAAEGLTASQWLTDTPKLPGSAELFAEADRNGLSLKKSGDKLYVADGLLKIADIAGTDEGSITSALREVLSRPKYEKAPDNKFSQLAAQIEAEHGDTPIGGALVALLRLAAKYGNFMDSFSGTSFSTDLEKDEYKEKTLSPEELAALNVVKMEKPFIIPTYGQSEASTLYASSKLFGAQYSIPNQKEFAAKLHNSPNFENKGANKNDLLTQGLVTNTVMFFSLGESANEGSGSLGIRDVLTGYVNESGQLSYYDKFKGDEVVVDMNAQSFALKAAFVPASVLPLTGNAVAETAPVVTGGQSFVSDSVEVVEAAPALEQ